MHQMLTSAHFADHDMWHCRLLESSQNTQITELQDHVLHRTCRRCADTLWARRPLLAAGGRSRWDSQSRRCWRSGSVPLLPRGVGSSSVVPPAEPSSHRNRLEVNHQTEIFFFFTHSHDSSQTAEACFLKMESKTTKNCWKPNSADISFSSFHEHHWSFFELHSVGVYVCFPTY